MTSCARSTAQNHHGQSRSATGAPLLVVTGTDTCVGKTLLTALLLCHLRAAGHRALATKPFATGSTSDADLLDALQCGELQRELLNPFFFPTAVAPLVAAREAGRHVRIASVAARIREAAVHCDLLLVEGCGGLMTPLGQGFSLLDLLRLLPARVVIVAHNRLGVLNHVLLTHGALAAAGLKEVAIALMGVRCPDLSTQSNPSALRELSGARLLVEIPYLGRIGNRPAAIRKAACGLARQLSCLASFAQKRSVREKASLQNTGSGFGL